MALGREDDRLGGIGMEGAREILAQGVLADDQIVVLADILTVGGLGAADGKRDIQINTDLPRSDKSVFEERIIDMKNRFLTCISILLLCSRPTLINQSTLRMMPTLLLKAHELQ